VHVKGLTILGTRASTTPTEPTRQQRWTEAANRALILELIGRVELDVAPLVGDRVPPAGAAEAFHRLATEPAEHLGVLIDWAAA